MSDEIPPTRIDNALLVLAAQLKLAYLPAFGKPVLLLTTLLPENQEATLVIGKNIADGILSELPAFVAMLEKMSDTTTIN